MKKKASVSAPLLAMVLLGLPATAHAASFHELSAQGYKASTLASNKAGVLGWTLSKGNSRYFCRGELGVAYSGKNGMVSFSSSGRMITLDRKAFEKYMGGRDANLPRYEDLKAGRPRPDDVGPCQKLS
ncbi:MULTISPECIES: hypothetical protein [Agrobacterium]|uniref:hypothetical protein n=1 Tax=Agrobacterium TaxID=357 RepID=UPI000D1E5DD3|nr:MULTISPECIES: hypothetical protein [Agrobacterium]UNZ49446.1 hypothetical protein MLE07_08615 [Agrobacterium tumefaciens]